MARAALLEMRQHDLHPVESGEDVDAHHLLDVLVGGQLADRARNPASGVVHPRVHLAEPLERHVEDVPHLLPLGDVGDDRERVRARAGRNLTQLGLAARRGTGLPPLRPTISASAAPMPPLPPVITTTRSRTLPR